MSAVFILFDRDIQDVELIIHAFKKMNIPMIYVRTKCDNFKEGGQKAIETQLKIDQGEISKIDESCKEVIPVGYGMYNEIKKTMKMKKMMY